MTTTSSIDCIELSPAQIHQLLDGVLGSAYKKIAEELFELSKDEEKMLPSSQSQASSQSLGRVAPKACKHSLIKGLRET